MDNNELKQRMLDDIKSKVELFQKVSAGQYRIRCPLCGDSQKNLHDMHCYIKCSYDPNEPVLYNCFLCNSGGIVDAKFLAELDISGDYLKDLRHMRYNRISNSSSAELNIITGDPILGSHQTKYIEYRLGNFDYEDYERFKIIWNLENVMPFIKDQKIINTIPTLHDSVMFLSEDKSMLLIRSTISSDARWRKIPLAGKSESKSLYTIKARFDIFGDKDINVNIAEGIFDILSVYRNIGYDHDRSLYIATLGSNYMNGVDYAISKGFVGNNIVLNIFVDDDIDISKWKRRLKKVKWLFKKVTIYENVLAHDMGVREDLIKLKEYSV